MSRLQLALDVTDIDSSVEFYSKMFDTAPAKRREGYANFEISDPPLKLVLFEAARGGRLNHLGVETGDGTDVVAAEARLTDNGIVTTGVDDTVCCFATKTETWVSDPDGARWEWYVKTGDSEQMRPETRPGEADSACCSPATSEQMAGPTEGSADSCCAPV